MSWKNTEGKQNKYDCRIKASGACGSVSHRCARRAARLGHPEPRGDAAPREPCARTGTAHPALCLAAGCCSPSTENAHTAGTARASFKLQQLWALLLCGIEPSELLYSPAVCASLAKPHQLAGRSRSPSAARCCGKSGRCTTRPSPLTQGHEGQNRAETLSSSCR